MTDIVTPIGAKGKARFRPDQEASRRPRLRPGTRDDHRHGQELLDFLDRHLRGDSIEPADEDSGGES